MLIMDALLLQMRSKLDSGEVTTTDLALACDVSRQYIYKILRGESHPTVPVAEKLAAAIGLEITLKKATRKKILV
jgi:transcriptional regulator with XRE-family HTH domain